MNRSVRVTCFSEVDKFSIYVIILNKVRAPLRAKNHKSKPAIKPITQTAISSLTTIEYLTNLGARGFRRTNFLYLCTYKPLRVEMFRPRDCYSRCTQQRSYDTVIDSFWWISIICHGSSLVRYPQGRSDSYQPCLT